MSRIRFTVEDSKVSEILKELLNLGIEITDLEVSTSELDKTISLKSELDFPYFKEE